MELVQRHDKVVSGKKEEASSSAVEWYYIALT